MRGLLADVNLEAHAERLPGLFDRLGLGDVLAGAHLVVATLNEIGLPLAANDRFLWTYCQQQGWVLFTDNRNDDGPDSLEATLRDSWSPGCLPVVTLAKQLRFMRSGPYRRRVAEDLAELLFAISQDESRYRSSPRIWVPLP